MLNMLVFSREDYKNLFYENCEYNVMYTADYHTALKHIRKNTTDIAVLDFDIPGASLLCRYAADSGVTVVSLCPDNSMVIKTALEDTDNIKDCLYGNFKKDIIYIKEETTDDAGILIIYSTKYNLGSAFNALVEESTEEYYGTEKEED